MKWTGLLLVVGVIAGCRSSSSKHAGNSETIPPTTKSHLPVLDLLTADLRKVEAEAGAILMKTRSGSRKDSLFIRPDEFKKEASAFLFPVLDSAQFQKMFLETSLMDETSGLLHFIYSPQQPDAELQQVIVYIRPTLSTDKVRSIYLEQSKRQGPRSVQRKMTWKIGHYFQIAELQTTDDGTENTIVKKVIWDPEYFQEE